MPVNVALFISPYCNRCASARQRLRAVLRDAYPADAIHYEECSVLEHLDRAVQLRVTSTPTLVVNNVKVPIPDWRLSTLRRVLADVIENPARHTT